MIHTFEMNRRYVTIVVLRGGGAEAAVIVRETRQGWCIRYAGTRKAIRKMRMTEKKMP